MTVQEVKKLNVGSIIRDCLGCEKTVVRIEDGILYELKWKDNNGNLSKGSEYQVPCHFEYDTIVKY